MIIADLALPAIAIALFLNGIAIRGLREQLRRDCAEGLRVQVHGLSADNVEQLRRLAAGDVRPTGPWGPRA